MAATPTSGRRICEFGSGRVADLVLRECRKCGRSFASPIGDVELCARCDQRLIEERLSPQRLPKDDRLSTQQRQAEAGD